MDIVQTILSMCTGPCMNRLSSLIGENESTTKSAVGTAVPALLAGLAHLTSTPGGAQRVASTMNQYDASSPDPIAGLLGNQPSSIADQGGSMLQSLFGGGISSGLGSLLSRFTGLGGGTSSKLLSFLAPMVMGGIAKHFSGQTITPTSLSSFFDSQKTSISRALPAGFSLSDIPGISSLTSAASSAASTAGRTAQSAYNQTADAASSAGKWAVPAIVGLLILAAIIYFATRSSSTSTPQLPTARLPAVSVPDVSTVRTTISSTISSINDSLASVKDSASADSALPKLRELDSSLDTAKSWTDKLPAPSKSTIADYTTSTLSPLVDRMNTALSNPGVPQKIQPTLQSIVTKLSDIAGVPSSQYTLKPTPTVPTASENQ